MINFALINKITQKTISRDHTFFSNPHKYKQYVQDKHTFDPSKITDLSLECLGYGQFRAKQIVNRFTSYFKQCCQEMDFIRNLRLKINGFDLKQCPNLITDLCLSIESLNKSNLKILQFQTTKLVNCDVVRDFGGVIRTTIRLGIKERQGLIKNQNGFQSLTLQFSDWQFLYKGQKCQPNPQTLKNQLGLIQDEAFNTDGYCFKKFRLQMSTWYYTQKQAQIFFHSFDRQQFHVAIDSFVRSCYNNMPDLQYFQLDLRNWFSSFQLTHLRDQLMMIPKEGVQNMSINSKNISRIRKKKEQINKMSIYEPDHQDDIILFERHIIV